jgi:hypothetical protein
MLAGDETRQWTVTPFVDAHVHVMELPESAGTALVRAGVTSVRDLGGVVARVRDWEAASDGPRVVSFGGQLDQHPLPAHMSTRLGAAGVRHFGDVVDHTVAMTEQGAAGIKLYVNFPPELVAPTVKHAHRRGLKVAFHLGTGTLPGFSRLDPVDVLEAGVDSVEHIHSLTSDLLEPRRLGDFLTERIETVGDAFSRVFRAWAEIDPDGRRSRRLVRSFAATGAVLVPTLTPFDLMARHASRDGRALTAIFGRECELGPETLLTAVDNMAGFVVALQRGGGLVAVGTDSAGATGVDPTSSFKAELRILSSAGMDAAELLRAASPTDQRAERLGVSAAREHHLLLRGTTLLSALLGEHRVKVVPGPVPASVPA